MSGLGILRDLSVLAKFQQSDSFFSVYKYICIYIRAAEFDFSASARGFLVPKFAFGANLLFSTVFRVLQWRSARLIG